MKASVNIYRAGFWSKLKSDWLLQIKLKSVGNVYHEHCRENLKNVGYVYPGDYREGPCDDVWLLLCRGLFLLYRVQSCWKYLDRCYYVRIQRANGIFDTSQKYIYKMDCAPFGACSHVTFSELFSNIFCYFSIGVFGFIWK